MEMYPKVVLAALLVVFSWNTYWIKSAVSAAGWKIAGGNWRVTLYLCQRV